MAQLAGAPWRGNVAVRIVEGVGQRRFRCTAGAFVIPGPAGDGDTDPWEGDPGATVTFRLDWETTGAPTIQVPTSVRVEVRLPDGAVVGSTWDAGGGASGSFTRTVHFDMDPLDQVQASPGNRRSGMLEVYLFVERTGVGSYTADSRGANTGAASAVGITHDWAQGYIRSHFVMSNHSLSDASIGGAEPSEFWYPDNVFLRAAMSEQAYEPNTITARLRQGGVDRRTKAHGGSGINRDFSWSSAAEKIDTTTPAGSYDVRLELTAADFGGDNKFMWASTGHQAGWTVNSELQIEDLTRFTVDPAVVLSLVSTPDSILKVWNRGEVIAGIVAKIVNAGGEGFSARGVETFKSVDIASGEVEETLAITSHDHTDGVAAGEHSLDQTFTSSGNVAPADAVGSAKALRWRDSQTNSPQPADTGQYALLSSLLNVYRHLQLNDNMLDPTLNVQSLLTSDLAFLAVRVENVRDEPVNGATGTLKMQDQGDLLGEFDLGAKTTQTVNGHVGYTPLSSAWQEPKPGGGWDLHADPDFTKDGNTGVLDRNVADLDGFNRIALLAIDPSIRPIAGVGPGLAAGQGNHFHVGDVMLIGAALFDRRTRSLRTPDADPTPVAYVGRFNVSTGRAEYLASDLSWQPLGVADAWALAPSAGDPKVFVRTFADTTGFSEHKLFAVCVIYLDGTPYIVDGDNDTLSALANPHDAYATQESYGGLLGIPETLEK